VAQVVVKELTTQEALRAQVAHQDKVTMVVLGLQIPLADGAQQEAAVVLAQSVQTQQVPLLEMVAQVHHLLSVVHLSDTLAVEALVDLAGRIFLLTTKSLEELQVLVAVMAEMELTTA
jgi:hypothetical protein